MNGKTLIRLYSFVIGLSFAFIVMTVAKYTPLNVYRGQLIAGDPAVNAEFPTTLGVVQDTATKAAPYAHLIWWVAVLMLGIALTPFVIRFVRRYV